MKVQVVVFFLVVWAVLVTASLFLLVGWIRDANDIIRRIEPGWRASGSSTDAGGES